MIAPPQNKTKIFDLQKVPPPLNYNLNLYKQCVHCDEYLNTVNYRNYSDVLIIVKIGTGL